MYSPLNPTFGGWCGGLWCVHGGPAVQRSVRRVRMAMPCGVPPDMRMDPDGHPSPPGSIQRVMRRRATLPHPVECSTIAVLGLSFRVRNGTGRLPQALTAANLELSGRPTNRRTGRWWFGDRRVDARIYDDESLSDHQALSSPGNQPL